MEKLDEKIILQLNPFDNICSVSQLGLSYKMPLTDLNKVSLFSHSYGGYKSKIKETAGVEFYENLLLGV